MSLLGSSKESNKVPCLRQPPRSRKGVAATAHSCLCPGQAAATGPWCSARLFLLQGARTNGTWAFPGQLGSPEGPWLAPWGLATAGDQVLREMATC